MKIAVIAGTSEATELIAALPAEDTVTAFAATAYGKEILAGQHCTVHVGRLDTEGFRQALRGMHAVVDASHPFAQEVTKTVRQVCTELQLPYFRLGRQKMTYAYDKLVPVDSKEAAAAYLAGISGNILLTTGGNTLSFYAENVPEFAVRGWARILDTPDSRRLTEPFQAHCIYAKPPFSQAGTEKLLREHQIAVLVSKDSGKRGGVAEKIAAAKTMQIPVVLITAPEESVHTIAEVAAQLQQYRRNFYGTDLSETHGH